MFAGVQAIEISKAHNTGCSTRLMTEKRARAFHLGALVPSKGNTR